MDAKEYRLGNLIAGHRGVAKITELESITNGNKIKAWYIEEPAFGVSETSESMQPIELTEEWLFKMGFKKDEEYRGMTSKWTAWVSNDIAGKLQFDLYDKHFEYFLSHHRLSNPFKYVHQLQNLCFALIGNELKIK